MLFRSFGEQPLAPALDGMQASFLGVGSIGPPREPRPDRRRIDVAHQPADELELAAARLALLDSPCRFERIEKPLRQIKLGQAGRANLEQRFAQGLESVHLGLAPRL